MTNYSAGEVLAAIQPAVTSVGWDGLARELENPKPALLSLVLRGEVVILGHVDVQVSRKLGTDCKTHIIINVGDQYFRKSGTANRYGDPIEWNGRFEEVVPDT